MQIHPQMRRRHVSWAQRVSVFAVPSICSSRADRIDAFREMICSDTVEEREAALEKILPVAAGRLREAVRGSGGHARLPSVSWIRRFMSSFRLRKRISRSWQTHRASLLSTIKNIIDSLHEFNPMMGHRGCRLAVTYPEIAKMQTRAVIRAAINVKKAHR